jgi:asparagine synthase (glutamine-hydrolysing)
MCGISGYFAVPGKYNGNAMVNSLHHRGPDSEGSLRFPLFNKELFLGHNRLSIIDLSPAGNQPMVEGDNELVVVFNGEIYNFLELKEAHLKNEQFRSTSDTEVLLKLYKKLGIQFLDLLNGDFAFALYDKRIQRLFVVRDRMGVKPLYYHLENGELIFGSEIAALLKGGVMPELNKDLIHTYFAFKYLPQQYTFLKNIHRLKPGTWLEFNLENGKCEEHIFWELPLQAPATSTLSYHDACAEVKRLIGDAVRLRLIADVPIGTFLSGGLDSSIIASHLIDHPELTHYCAGKNKEDLAKEGSTSDFDYARRLATDWKLNLVEIPIGSAQLNPEMLQQVLHTSDDLIADGSQIPGFLISKAASEKTRVLLSGMGADELFLGYAGHQLSMMSQYGDALPKMMMRPLSSFLANLNQGKGFLKVYKRYLHKIGKYQELPYRYALFSVVGDYDSATAIYSKNQQFTKELISGYFENGNDPFYNLLRFESDNFLVKNLHYTDRTTMANAIECRVPFLDYRIVEFASKLPLSFKMGKTLMTKRILKDAYKDVLPKYITHRRKAGFGMPLRSLLAQQEVINKMLHVDFFGSIEGFDVEAIKRSIEHHQQGKSDNSALLFALICFEQWYRTTFSI